MSVILIGSVVKRNAPPGNISIPHEYIILYADMHEFMRDLYKGVVGGICYWCLLNASLNWSSLARNAPTYAIVRVFGSKGGQNGRIRWLADAVAI